MNLLNSPYKYIFALILIIAFLLLFTSKFKKNEKVKLNDNIQTENIETTGENIFSETIADADSDLNKTENYSIEKKEKNKHENKALTEKKKKKSEQETKKVYFDNPMLTVNELHKGLEEIDFDNRINSLNRIRSLVKRTYNSKKMTAMIIGKSWKNIEDEKRIKLIEVMEEYIASNYISRFSKLSKVNFENQNVRQIQQGFKIVNTLLKLKKDNVNIDYLLSKTDGEWKIFDVLLDSSVSEVATKKSEFSNFISEQNIDKLIQALEDKNIQLQK